MTKQQSTNGVGEARYQVIRASDAPDSPDREKA